MQLATIKKKTLLPLSLRSEKYVKNEKYLWLLATWALYETIIYQLLAYATVFVQDYNVFANTAYFSGYAVLLLLCLFRSFEWGNMHMNAGIAIVAGLTCLTYILTRLFRPASILDDTFNFGFSPYKLLLFYLPVMVVISQMTDLRGWLFSLRHINLFMTALATYFLYRRMRGSEREEAMMIAYMIALCAIISIYCAAQNYNRKVNVVFCIVDFSLLLLAGSRGAWLTMMIYLGYTLLRNTVKATRGTMRVLGLFVIVLVIGFIAFFYMEILRGLCFTLDSFGLSSRVLNKMIDGELAQSSGRQLLQQMIFKKWDRLPFFGYGFLADRNLTRGFGYAHNIAIEFICDFGWVPGITLLSLLGLSVLRLLLFRRTQETILVGTYVITYLMFSISYLMCGTFWIFLGLLYGENRRYKQAPEDDFLKKPKRKMTTEKKEKNTLMPESVFSLPRMKK